MANLGKRNWRQADGDNPEQNTTSGSSGHKRYFNEKIQQSLTRSTSSSGKKSRHHTDTISNMAIEDGPDSGCNESHYRKKSEHRRNHPTIKSNNENEIETSSPLKNRSILNIVRKGKVTFDSEILSNNQSSDIHKNEYSSIEKIENKFEEDHRNTGELSHFFYLLGFCEPHEREGNVHSDESYWDYCTSYYKIKSARTINSPNNKSVEEDNVHGHFYEERKAQSINKNRNAVPNNAVNNNSDSTICIKSGDETQNSSPSITEAVTHSDPGEKNHTDDIMEPKEQDQISSEIKISETKRNKSAEHINKQMSGDDTSSESNPVNPRIPSNLHDKQSLTYALRLDICCHEANSLDRVFRASLRELADELIYYNSNIENERSDFISGRNLELRLLQKIKNHYENHFKTDIFLIITKKPVENFSPLHTLMNKSTSRWYVHKLIKKNRITWFNVDEILSGNCDNIREMKDCTGVQAQHEVNKKIADHFMYVYQKVKNDAAESQDVTPALRTLRRLFTTEFRLIPHTVDMDKWLNKSELMSWFCYGVTNHSENSGTIMMVQSCFSILTEEKYNKFINWNYPLAYFYHKYGDHLYLL